MTTSSSSRPTSGINAEESSHQGRVFGNKNGGDGQRHSETSELVQSIAPVIMMRGGIILDQNNALVLAVSKEGNTDNLWADVSLDGAFSAQQNDIQLLSQPDMMTLVTALTIAGEIPSEQDNILENLSLNKSAPLTSVAGAGVVVNAPDAADMLAIQNILANMEPAAGDRGGSAGRAGGSGFGSSIDPAMMLGLGRLGGIAATWLSGLENGTSNRNSGSGDNGLSLRPVSLGVANDATSSDDQMIFDGSPDLFGTGNVLDNDKSTSGALILKTVTFEGIVHDVPETGTVEIMGVMGLLSIQSNGDYMYAPLDAKDLGADISGIDLFQYTAQDAAGVITTATLAVTVNDRIPMAVDDIIATDHMNPAITGTLLSGDQLGNGAMRLGTVNGQAVGPNGITIDRPDLGYKIVIAADGSYTMTAANLKSGIDTITYSTIDADGDASGTAIVAISFADTAPTLTSKTVASTNMTLVTTGSILSGSDTMGDGSVRVGSVSGQLMPAGGSLILDTNDYILTIQSNGDYRLEGKNGRTATNVQIPITTVDSDGDISNTAVITVSVRDRVPEVMEESTTVLGGLNVNTQAITGIINGALIPDTAGDGAHRYELLSSPQGRFGTITLGSDGLYRYNLNSTKDVLTNTTDLYERISYRVTDEDGDTSISDLFIIIDTDGSWQLANLLPNGVDETVILEGALNVATQQIIGTMSGNVLSNGDSVGNNPAVVTLQGTGQGLFGSIVINANGSYNYTLDSRATKTSLQGPLVDERFVYRITDADGDVSSAAITIRIGADGSWSQNNLIPVASGEIVAVDGGLDVITQRVTGSISGTVLDAQDNVGDGLSRVELVGSANGAHGTLTLSADGTYSYALNDTKQNLQGNPTDTFTYRIIDRDGDVSNTVILTVNIGSDGSWSTSNNLVSALSENETLVGTLNGARVVGTLSGKNVTSNDNLGDAPARVTLTGSSTGKFGSIVLNADGTYTYTLNADKNDMSGDLTEIFLYRVTDKDGDTSAATLTINITSDGTWVAENTAPIASDGNGGTSTAEIAVTGNIISALVSSGNGLKTITTISINGGAAIAIGATDSVHTGTHGTLTIRADGSYSYVGRDDAVGTDRITYTVRDSDGDTDTGVLTLGTTDSAPNIDNAANNSVATQLNAITGTFPITAGDGATRLLVNGTPVINAGTQIDGTHGILTINPDGSYSYIAKDGAGASDTFTLAVTDQDGDRDTATLTLTGRDLRPVVGDVTASGSGNGSTDLIVAGNLLEQSSSGDGTLRMGTVFGFAVPAGGVLTLTGADLNVPGSITSLTIHSDGSYTLVAPRGASIGGSLSMSVIDADGDETYGNINLSINNSDATAGTPTLSADALNLSEDGTGRLIIRATNNDPDSERLTITATIPAGWTVIDLAGGTLVAGVWTHTLGVGDSLAGWGPVVQPPANWSGSTNISVSVISTENNGGDVSAPVSTQISVTVNAVNDRPVIIDEGTTATGSIDENRPAGTPIVTLSGSDLDGNSTWSLSGPGSENFDILQDGTIRNRIPLDADTGTTVYNLTATYSDGLESATRAVEIRVNNLNDNAPTISLSGTGSVMENVAEGTEVTGISISGGDTDGNPFIYEIIGGNTNNAFRIDPTSGRVYTNGPIDRETIGSYTLNIQTRDSGGLTSTPQAVQIQIGNDPERPVLVSAPSAVDVAENASVGSVLGNINVRDPENRPLKFDIVSGDTNGNFSVDQNGRIIVQRNNIAGDESYTDLNFEGVKQHNLVIRATDETGLTIVQDIAVTVNVTNVDERPMILSNESFLRDENTTTNSLPSVIGSFSASDPERNISSVQIVGGTGQGIFNLQSNGSFWLATTNQSINYETMGPNKFYTLDVQAVDATGLRSDTQTIRININDVNEAPIIQPGTHAGTIAENDTSSVITTVRATDPENQIVSWRLVGADADKFTIDASGNIRATGTGLNYEEGRSGTYDLYAIARESSSLQQETPPQKITVTVTDVAEGPVFLNTLSKPSWVTVTAYNPDGTVGQLYSNGRFGVGGGTNGDEIDFVTTINDQFERVVIGSEKIAFDFNGNTATSAQVSIAKIDGDGHWVAKHRGEVVAQAHFSQSSYNRDNGTFQINPGIIFDRLEFTVLDNGRISHDNTDYQIVNMTLYNIDPRGYVYTPPSSGGGGGGGRNPVMLNPIVLDLNHDDQINLISINKGVMFDMTNDGILDHTGWVAAEDGQLALDLNGNGIIDNQHELFGSPMGSPLELNGFTELVSYDENGDGKVSSMDSIWSKLIVWQDLNQDGISQSGEMKSVVEYEIASIDTAAARIDQTVAGNKIYWDGNITMNDGSSMDIVDAYYQVVEGVVDTATDVIAATASSIDAAISATLIEQLSSSATTDIDAAIHEFLIATGSESSVTSDVAPIEIMPHVDRWSPVPVTLPYDER